MRLIDIDEIKLPQGFFEKVDNVPKFYEWLSTLPTVDVMEVGVKIFDDPEISFRKVVRCKDCKHNSLNRMSGNAYCDFGFGLYQLNDFCSRGERREDDTK